MLVLQLMQEVGRRDGTRASTRHNRTARLMSRSEQEAGTCDPSTGAAHWLLQRCAAWTAAQRQRSQCMVLQSQATPYVSSVLGMYFGFTVYSAGGLLAAGPCVVARAERSSFWQRRGPICKTHVL
jgi:hypothetical protein